MNNSVKHTNNASKIASILGKRKYNSAFVQESYDDERYGNHIADDYFIKGGIGHGEYVEKEKNK